MRLCEVSRRLAQAARDEGESALLKALCDLEVEASPDGVRLEKDAGALHVSAQDARERHVVRVTHVAIREPLHNFCDSTHILLQLTDQPAYIRSGRRAAAIIERLEQGSRRRRPAKMLRLVDERPGDARAFEAALHRRLRHSY